jgi:hypothetical protein
LIDPQAESTIRVATIRVGLIHTHLMAGLGVASAAGTGIDETAGHFGRMGGILQTSER